MLVVSCRDHRMGSIYCTGLLCIRAVLDLAYFHTKNVRWGEYTYTA